MLLTVTHKPMYLFYNVNFINRIKLISIDFKKMWTRYRSFCKALNYSKSRRNTRKLIFNKQFSKFFIFIFNCLPAIPWYANQVKLTKKGCKLQLQTIIISTIGICDSSGVVDVYGCHLRENVKCATHCYHFLVLAWKKKWRNNSPAKTKNSPASTTNSPVSAINSPASATNSAASETN